MTSKSLVQTGLRPLTAPLFWLVFLLNVLLLSLPTSAELLDVADVMAHPQHYDRKEVIVVGKVNHVEMVTDRQGQPAVQFFLEDAFGTLKVISRTEVQEGDQVIVEGTFARRRQAGRIPVYNEVKATSVRPLNQFNPDLVG